MLNIFYSGLKKAFSTAAVYKQNLCAELWEPAIIRMVKRRVPVPNEHEVLIKMGAVCLSPVDLILEKYGKVGYHLLKSPIILGTSGCGVVVQNKTKYTNIKEGDRVAIDATLHCGKCESCLAHFYENCEMGMIAGVPPTDGLLAQYVKHPAVKCYKLQDNVNMVKGALCRHIAICIKAYDLANINSETNIVIFGCGVTGHSMLLTAKAFGVGNVVMTDRNQRHLKTAQYFGSDYILTHDHKLPTQNISMIIAELLKGAPLVTLDTICTKETIEEACNTTREYGSMVMLKIPLHVKNINFMDQQDKKIKVLQAGKPAEYFQVALQAITEGKIKLHYLHIADYPLEKTIEAFDEAKKSAFAELKLIAIHCNEDIK